MSMDKKLFLVLAFMLVLNISFAQYGTEFITDNIYWIFAFVLSALVYKFVFKIFTNQNREEIAEGVGLLAAISIFIAMVLYKIFFQAFFIIMLVLLVALGFVYISFKLVKSI